MELQSVLTSYLAWQAHRENAVRQLRDDVRGEAVFAAPAAAGRTVQVMLATCPTPSPRRHENLKLSTLLCRSSSRCWRRAAPRSKGTQASRPAPPPPVAAELRRTQKSLGALSGRGSLETLTSGAPAQGLPGALAGGPDSQQLRPAETRRRASSGRASAAAPRRRRCRRRRAWKRAACGL